mgnify:CR=1 FL=1
MTEPLLGALSTFLPVAEAPLSCFPCSALSFSL